MSRGFPSMTALLGLIAIAGYQNRDKLAELLRGVTGGNTAGGGAVTGNAPQGQLGGLKDLLGGASVGGLLGGGLNELLERFNEAGQKDKAESWISTGPNKEIAPAELKAAIGPDVLQTLSRATGLSQDELLARLSKELPGAVDKYTPEGRIDRD
ncbi:MAG: DUF937 domain-containing protein [Pseudorhodoplanes sp.]|nr:DUF937 domain-containing protein [Pseudorhodoplanes sp.]